MNRWRGPALPVNKVILWLIISSLILSGCSSSVLVDEVDVEEEVATDAVVLTENASTPDVQVATEELYPVEEPTQAEITYDISTVIEYEMRGAFDFFWEQANTDVNSPGYGLVRDRYPGDESIASIASVGFALTAYLVGIDKGYITYQEGYDRVNGTLDTLLAMKRTEGFYYHFVDMKSTERAWGSEVSNIDTAILMMGVLSAGQYFGGEIQIKAEQLYDEVNWPWFIDENVDQFYMSYRPEKDRGFEGHWDFYAEQLMLYVLAAGSDTHPIEPSTYYAFTRHYAKYGGEPFIHSWFGSIFTYQFSHAWIDFSSYVDKDGVNWFENSAEACISQVAFATNMDDKYLTIGPNAWGLSASDGPNGYSGLYGAPPSGYDNKAHEIDDTVPPYGAIASIIFVPEAAKQAMLYYYSFDDLKSRYGFKDAFNLTEDWFASDVIGIDKGISLLMLSNYETGLVHQVMMENIHIQKGLERLQFTPVE